MRLRSGLLALIAMGRTRPHLYRLMFTPPAGDPTEVVRAAQRAQGLFLDIVGRVTGPRQARRYRALLLTSAHGITELDMTGHMDLGKWHTSAEELVNTLISVLSKAR